MQYRQFQNKNQYGSLQNGKSTQFCFAKLMTIEYYLTFIVISHLVLIIVQIIQEELTFPQIKQDNKIIVYILLTFNILCVIFQVILLYLRAQATLKLQQEQKLIYDKVGLIATKKAFYLIFQIIVVLIQPYLFFQNIFFQTEDSYNQVRFNYRFNDLLAIFSLGRLYIVLRTILYMTPYMNNRSKRICKMYSFQADTIFSIKCLYKDNPLVLIGFFFMVCAGIFGYAQYLAQRPLGIYSQPGTISICNNFANSLWLIVLTITTVGYGDYFPHTALGRLIILFVAICGTFIIMIMVVVVANTLQMQKNQKRTLQILQKLQMRAQVKQKSLKFISSFILLRKYRRTEDQQKIKQYQRQVRNFKRQFSQAKKKLQIMSCQQDIYDEIATHFLNLNSDIQILNKNQDNIIQFIHNHLQFNDGGKSSNKEFKNSLDN